MSLHVFSERSHVQSFLGFRVLAAHPIRTF
jgi:hypothetical protein